MRKRRVASIAFTGAAVAAAGTVVHIPAARAASGHWTINPGGKYTAAAGATSLSDVTAGAKLTCTSATAAGSLSKTSFTQTGSTSFKAGPVSKGTFGSSANTCAGPLGLAFDAVLNHATLNAKSFKSGITHGKMTSISATLHGVGVSCTATITGSQPYSYNNATHQLTVLGGATADSLTATAVTGCLGVVKTGDKNFFHGAYTVSPAQTITDP